MSDEIIIKIFSDDLKGLSSDSSGNFRMDCPDGKHDRALVIFPASNSIYCHAHQTKFNLLEAAALKFGLISCSEGRQDDNDPSPVNTHIKEELMKSIKHDFKDAISLQILDKIKEYDDVSVKTIIDVEGVVYESIEELNGKKKKTPTPNPMVLEVVLTKNNFEFYDEDDRIINRFNFKGKAKNSQITNFISVVRNMGAFDKPVDAKKWFFEKNIFDKLSKLKEDLDEKIKQKKEKDIIRKYELKVIKPDVSKDVSKQVMVLLLQGAENEASEIIVKKIENDEHIKTLRNDKNEEIWIYQRQGFNEGIYIPNGRSYIQEICRGILGDAYENRIYKNVIEKIKADSFIDPKEFFEEQHVDLIAVQNGILNIKTRELIPFSPEYKFFNKHPVNYIPGAECPYIKKFFKSLFKHAAEIDVIQEIFGFSLYRDYFLEKAFMFLGNGRNGKGKTILLLKRFLGAENTSEIPLEDLERDLYSIGEMHGKNANLAGDLSKTALRKSGKFKSLTGRDPINAARKYLSRLAYINYAKMIFACNELPFTYDVTDAFFDRWIILDFPFRFLPEKEIINDKENRENNLVKIQDPKIIDKISTPEELSGLLNWALIGLERLFQNNSFSYSPSTNEVRNLWLRKSDSCLAFVMDNITEDYDEYITKADFKAKYSDFCRKHKLTISDDKKINEILTTISGAFDSRKSIDGSQIRVWAGVKFDEKKAKKTPKKSLNLNPKLDRVDAIDTISHKDTHPMGKVTLQKTMTRMSTLSNVVPKKSEGNEIFLKNDQNLEKNDPKNEKNMLNFEKNNFLLTGNKHKKNEREIQFYEHPLSKGLLQPKCNKNNVYDQLLKHKKKGLTALEIYDILGNGAPKLLNDLLDSNDVILKDEVYYLK